MRTSIKRVTLAALTAAVLLGTSACNNQEPAPAPSQVQESDQSTEGGDNGPDDGDTKDDGRDNDRDDGDTKDDGRHNDDDNDRDDKHDGRHNDRDEKDDDGS